MTLPPPNQGLISLFHDDIGPTALLCRTDGSIGRLTGPNDVMAQVDALLSLLKHDGSLNKRAIAKPLPQPALLLFMGGAGLLDRIEGDFASDRLGKDEDFEAKHPRFPARSSDGKPGSFAPKGAAPSEGSSEDEERGGIGGNSGNKEPLKPERDNATTPRKTQAEKLEEEAKSREIYKRIMQLRTLIGAVVRSPDVGLFLRAAMEQLVAIIKSAKTDDLPTLKAALDEPKSYDELRVDSEYHEFKSMDAFERKYGPAPPGYEYHHIVEQGGKNNPFPPEKLHNTENVILVPKLKHEEITGIYNGKDANFGTYRKRVRTLSYDEQLAIGADNLRIVGVLK